MAQNAHRLDKILARDHVDAIALLGELGEHRLAKLGRDVVIGIDKRDKVPLRVVQAHEPRLESAEIALVAHDAHARVCREILCERYRVVFAAVINEYDFDVAMSLLKAAVQAFFDVFLRVVCGDDDRDERRF